MTRTYGEWDGDGGEDQGWPVWRPVVGLLVALLLLTVVAAICWAIAPSKDRAVVAGFSAAQAVAVYALLYVAALARRGIVWKIGALAALLGWALLVNFGQAAQKDGLRLGDMEGVRRDVSAALDGKELKIERTEEVTLASVTRNMLVRMQADQRAYVKELEAAGVPALTSPAKVKARPEVLKNCDRIAGLDAVVTRYQGLWLKHFADARSVLASKEGRNARAALKGFDEAQARSRTENARRWELEHDAIRELAGMCRILARRNWEGGETFMFTNDRDFQAYRTAADRFNAMLAEQQRLEAAANSRVRTSMEKLPR